MVHACDVMIVSEMASAWRTLPPPPLHTHAHTHTTHGKRACNTGNVLGLGVTAAPVRQSGKEATYDVVGLLR